MAVPAADEHQRPQHPGIENLPRLEKRRVITQVETHLRAHPAGFRGSYQRHQLGAVSGRGFLDQHVFSGVDCGVRDRRQELVRGCHDDGIHIGPADGFPPVGGGHRPGTLAGQLPGALHHRVGRDDQLMMFAERTHPFLPDHAAADNRQTDRLQFHSNPRSFGTIRRMV